MNLSEDTTIRLSFKTFSLAIKTVGNLIISMKCRPNEIPTSSSLSMSSAAASAASGQHHSRYYSISSSQAISGVEEKRTPSAITFSHCHCLHTHLTPVQCRPATYLPLRLNSKLNMAISLSFCHQHSKYKIKKY